MAFDGLLVADADLSYTAKRLLVGPMDTRDVKARVKLGAGKLAVSPIALSMAEGGRINAWFKVDGAAKTPKVSANVKIDKIDIGPLLDKQGFGNLVTLLLNGGVDFTTKGASSQVLMANLDGKVRLGGRDGSINDKLLTDLTAGLGEALPWASQESGNVITCFVADLPIENGVATAQAVQVETPGFSVAVTGNVDLSGELLHLTVVPDAKTTSLASFAVPVRVKGPLSAPYLDIDPGDAVKGTVKNIVKAPVTLLTDLFDVKQEDDGKNDPCVEALSGGKTPSKSDANSKSKKQSAPPPQQKSGEEDPNAVDQLGEKLGGALKDLFGK
ncbi:AsmA family protein [Pseudomonadota bacterium]